jgi:dipeptidyl aminopeptidase/acylaminoacyl peptidase
MDLDQAVPDALGDFVILTFSERRAPARPGMLPDYLSKQVTTRPVRGTAAADPSVRQCLRVARLGHPDFLTGFPGESPARNRFEIVASRADGLPVHPVRFVVAVNAEDRRGREVYALTAKPGARLASECVLKIPAPAMGNERLLAGPGAPVVMSEAGGFGAQLFTFDRDGRFVAFSPREVDVSWCGWTTPGRPEQEKVTIALVTEPSAPHERRLWRMFRSGAPHAPLPVEGMFISSCELSRDGSTLVFLASRLGEAEDLYSMPADGSGAPRRITFTAPAAGDAPGPAVPMRVVHYRSGDGQTVWAYYYEPPAGVRRNGAAVVFLHGAGYLQQVRASSGNPNYAANHHFHRRLAAKGYVVFAPDFRGSAGYGRKFRTDVYQNLGIPDSADIVAAKAWLAEHARVDPDRIGLYGGSYGGFLTLMCLFLHPDDFACGAALRSVTDWRAYSAEYTRPLLGGGPDEVPNVYARTSPIDHAANLKKPLLLLHGMQDDNVFVQDTIRLVEELQKLGKTRYFELMLFPSQNHGFTSTHAWVDEYQRIEDFFDRHLLK